MREQEDKANSFQVCPFLPLLVKHRHHKIQQLSHFLYLISFSLILKSTLIHFARSGSGGRANQNPHNAPKPNYPHTTCNHYSTTFFSKPALLLASALS